LLLLVLVLERSKEVGGGDEGVETGLQLALIHDLHGSVLCALAIQDELALSNAEHEAAPPCPQHRTPMTESE